MLIETAMNCSDIHWTEPVKVRGPQGQVIKIDGPLAALNAMTHQWPGGKASNTIGPGTCAWRPSVGEYRRARFGTISSRPAWTQASSLKTR